MAGGPTGGEVEERQRSDMSSLPSHYDACCTERRSARDESRRVKLVLSCGILLTALFLLVTIVVQQSHGQRAYLEEDLSALGDPTKSSSSSIRQLADERINHWMQLKLPNLDANFLDSAGRRGSSSRPVPMSHASSSEDFQEERKKMREEMIKSFSRKAEESTAEALSSQGSNSMTFPTLSGMEGTSQHYVVPTISPPEEAQASRSRTREHASRLQASALASKRKEDASASAFVGGKFSSKASSIVDDLISKSLVISKSLGKSDQSLKRNALNRIQAYHQAVSSSGSSSNVIHYPGENSDRSDKPETKRFARSPREHLDEGDSTSGGVQDHLFDLYTSNKNAQSYLNQDGGRHRGMAQLSAPASVAMASSRDDVDTDGGGGDPFNNALFNIVHDCSLGGPTC
ncbi:hypothetical protein GUITHDRAFT_100328 [Guillardia theta CCMP2712]|uniref:Uncharacterized protein n=1 Tax=Guillardia theta (strain CCMP2712) TaxID=905079 RepID=L1K0V1_GUITC|nr:hypothetical protein GUITHDRAFT_100328 [Guillardia theta CCMP2712]EKX54080.1 hypothetical protein GUITHDRAFT_100328 [Guillardia theta CCMP2712]|mmetsp:Transcript_15657/g.52387  ORF Transcript_15657/g.52387 Transcript_15657/m.52387 type:complete len:402 (-) Transcript_15657:61-1266(-)|eukprot:XP_005841060.1 hypothetical protein GUITHDRAFT_100328 [Guillardia theta CCMP2712]